MYVSERRIAVEGASKFTSQNSQTGLGDVVWRWVGGERLSLDTVNTCTYVISRYMLPKLFNIIYTVHTFIYTIYSRLFNNNYCLYVILLGVGYIINILSLARLPNYLKISYYHLKYYLHNLLSFLIFIYQP